MHLKQMRYIMQWILIARLSTFIRLHASRAAHVHSVNRLLLNKTQCELVFLCYTHMRTVNKEDAP